MNSRTDGTLQEMQTVTYTQMSFFILREVNPALALRMPGPSRRGMNRKPLEGQGNIITVLDSTHFSEGSLKTSGFTE